MIYDIILLISALCGFIMVGGGILLLYKGAISLSGVSSDAFTLEYKKELRLSTRNPAIALFLIGLLFLAVALIQGKPDMTKLTVKGEIEDVDEPVRISLITNTSNLESDLQYNDKILATFYPNIDHIQIEVAAPGYEPYRETVPLSRLRRRTHNMKSIHLTQTFTKDQIQGGAIEDLPSDFLIPTITEQHQFGGSK